MYNESLCEPDAQTNQAVGFRKHGCEMGFAISLKQVNDRKEVGKQCRLNG